MPDKRSKFHEFALKSILFKGRADWYFCYLKTERIAHVLAVLESMAPQPLSRAADLSAGLPADIAHLAAGEIEAPLVLADVFSVLTAIRLAATNGALHKENAQQLEKEYEQVAERLVTGSHPSPFVGSADFEVPLLEEPIPFRTQNVLEKSFSIKDIRDTQKDKGLHSERMLQILEHLRRQKSASIKDIATVIKGCSEKTIQRELGILIEEGLVKRVGERRWSVYMVA